MCALFNSNPCILIISYYGATIPSDKTNITPFYYQLSSLVRCVSEHNIVIISEDMNDQIGKDEKNKFCLHNSSNRNGEYQKDISLENRQTSFYTKFQKKGGKLWT